MDSLLDQERVLRELEPLLPNLYRYIEAGLAEAAEFFVSRKAQIDNGLASHMTRWSFLQSLRSEAPLLNIENIEELGLSGISFWYADYHIRVWKAGTPDDEDVTRLASSSTKEAFFAQQMMFPWVTERYASLNLAVLWDVDPDWHLFSLQVGPPREENGRFVLVWHVDIPSPMDTLRFIDAGPSEPEFHFERNDVDIDSENTEDE